MHNSSPVFSTLLARAGLLAPVLALLTLFAQSSPAAVITSVVETGGDNEPTDTITAKWTGSTFNCSVTDEPVPGLTIGTPYTVGPFGNYAPCYVDRNHRYTNASATVSIPSYLRGQEYIMSGNDNRDNATYRLDVTVSTTVQVYLLIDNRLQDGDANTPPTFGPANMQWVLDEGWVAVTTGANRSGNPALPDEVGIDEGANNTIDNWFSVYTKRFLAGTFALKQADNAGRNMYGAVVTPYSAGSYEAAVLADGPLAYWRFDYDTAPTAKNQGTLGAAADGTYNGGAAPGAQALRPPAFLGFDPANTALQCDGVNDFVGVATSLMNSRPVFTISGWMRRNADQLNRTGLWGQNDIVEFGYINNGTLEVWTDNGLDIPNAIPNQQWAHLAIVSTGSGGANTISMYTNGVLAGSRAHVIPADNAFPFNIGGGGIFDAIGANGNYFNGQIDEVALYDKALTAAQIATQYRAAFKLSTKTNVFAPGDPIALVNGVNDGDGNAGPPPGAEGVEHSIDRLTSKYLNFLDLGSGFATTPSLGPTIVQCIRLYTANDAEERDPASYLVEGSVSGLGGPWTTIASGPLALPTGRNPGGVPINPATQFNQLIEFPNNIPYTSYRVTFPTLKNAGAANSMQIGEVELLGASFPAAPRIVTQPLDITITEGHTATFSAVGDGSAPLTYQWFRKLSGEASFSPIAGATDPTYTTPVAVFPADNGSQFKVQVSNSFGSAESRAALLTVLDDTTAPAIVASFGSGDFAHATILFTEELEMGSAQDTFNYAIDGGLSILGAVLSTDRKSVTLATSPQTPDTVYTITVNNVLDLANNPIAPDSMTSFRSWITGPCNAVRFEAFDTASTPGNAVSLLTSHPNFPNNPRDVAFITRLDSRLGYPDDTHEQYGGRMRGVFFPPSSGAHIFYLAADDNAELWLSTDLQPAHKVLIATETSWSNTKEWTSSLGGSTVASKRSAPINLVGGKPYYIEALWKEGGGGDHCSVAVQLPTDAGPPANGSGDIPSSLLGESAPANFLGPITLNPALPADQSVMGGAVVTFAVGATAPADYARLCYEWQRDSNDGNGFQPIASANGSTYTIGPVGLSDNGSKFRCVVGSFATVATSREALLTVNVDTNPPVCASVRVLFDLTHIDIRFSEFVEAGTAGDSFNYTVDGSNPSGAALRPDGMTVRLTLATPLAIGGRTCISIQNVTDLAGNVINPNPSTKCMDTPIIACGLAFCQQYYGIPGNPPDFPNAPQFPNDDDNHFYVGLLESPTNVREDFGTRITGWLRPPVSGNYNFWMSSDDLGTFMLSTDENPANAVLLCSEPQWGGVREWQGNAGGRRPGLENQSKTLFPAGIPLVAGQMYWFQALSKEGGGGDNLAVAWQIPGDPEPANGSTPIQGVYMCGLADPGTTGAINITRQPCPNNICLPVPGLPPQAGGGGSALASQDFNANDGGCTVINNRVFEGPWTYNAAAGSWRSSGQGPDIGAPGPSTRLTCPAVTVTQGGNVRVSLSHRYSFESGAWDGGQIQISVNGGAYFAVPGASFVQNGYSGTVLPNSQAELNGQAAFIETSAGYNSATFITSVADLGCFSPGNTISIRFLAAYDTNTRQGDPAWEIDSVSFTQGVPQSGTTANFGVAASVSPANAPTFIQWEVSKGGGPYLAIDGANNATYSFQPTLADDGNCYRAVITIPGAMAISEVACLNVTQPNTPPRFVKGADQQVAEDPGPVCVPGWATEIFNHSIPRDRTLRFNSQPPNSTLYHGLDTGPTPDPDTSRGYIAGGVMHLTDPVNSSYGDLALNLPGTETFPTFDIRWRSLIGGGGGGGADGYSLNIGTDLPNPPSYGNPGEEGAGSGLRVAVDTFDNADIEVPDVGIEIVWQGSRVAAATIPKDNPGNGVYLRKNTFVDASLTVDATGLATFTYDGTTITANLAGFTGLTANQVMFGARTGGANDNQWIDDITSSQAWVDNFLPGDQSNAEANQTVKFIVTNDHPEKFSQQPSVSANGTLCYTPAPNACGNVIVTVTAMDDGGTDPQCGGNDMSAPQTFVIQIGCVNDCPVANASSVTVAQDGTVTFQLLASDPEGDTLSYEVTSPPLHGVLSVNPQTGVGNYTPSLGYCGPDSFRFRVSDGQCRSAEVTVSINVVCRNQCPNAVAKASPNAELRPNQTSTIVISVNNSNACVTLDGSMSTDPDGDTLTYVWLADLDGNGTKEPIASGAVVTYCFELGEHEIMLVVDDGRCARSVSLTVEVLSACEAVELVIDKIDNADLGRRNKRPLIATLKAACASFDRGNCVSAVAQLEAFQNKVRAQIGHTDPALADEIIALTQEILDAIDCEKGNNGRGNGEDPAPPGNPPPND